ncbi:MAG: PQ-loop repeat-containing protein [Prevotella sp.]|nr:PQ-loop repeat-containing protein [Prevotella sp.]
MIYQICGWLASITMVMGYLPQAIETIRTRNTDGIALPTFLMMAVGGMCFMLQGILHKPDVLWALFITNLITTTCSLIVFCIKLYNDYIKPKSKS